MMSVSEIGLSSELELITFSFGIGTIFALFHTSGTFPTFREIIAGAISAAYVFQNQCGRSSGPDDERFCFLRKL
jgi:hypothetical protein